MTGIDLTLMYVTAFVFLMLFGTMCGSDDDDDE